MAAPLGLVAMMPWLALVLRLRRRPAGARRDWTVECGCLLWVEAAGLFATWPYFQGTLIGAGDAYHYLLQMADAVTQFRQGVFPVLVGQTDYAFNGGVHTIRTAPYYLHLGGALDWLTGHRLDFAALQNLTVQLSTLGGALTAYYAVRRLAPARRVAAALLASAYVTSAGLLAPLYHYDMLATTLIAPWQPLFWLGIVLSLQKVRDGDGLLLSVASLGLLWYVHPPIAVWLTPVLVVTQFVRLLLVGRAEGNLLRPVFGVALMAVLMLYELYSVRSLHLHYSPDGDGTMPQAILANLQAAWPASFYSTISRVDAPLADLQLGFTLWAVLLLGSGWQVRRGVAGAVLLGALGAFVLLVIPVPHVTLALWDAVPSAVLNLTNSWPMQRFYPILAALALVAGALDLGGLGPGQRRLYGLGCILLGIGAAWSVSEAWALQSRARLVNAGPLMTAQMLRPENVELTRASYALFGAFPPYFSHGRMDPAFELRLLDENQQVVLDNTSAVLGQVARLPAPPPKLTIHPEIWFQTDGVHDYLLNFDLPADAKGPIIVHGHTRHFAYILPEFGGPMAFGARPTSAHAFPVRTGGLPAEKLSVQSPGVAVVMQAIPFSPADLLLQLESLVPLKVAADTPHAGLLETPRVFIPGYRATVNGRVVPVQCTAAGLVAVSMPAGRSQVVLDYPGPPGLVAVYYLSLVSLLFVWVWLGWRLWRNHPGAAGEAALDGAAIRRYHLFARTSAEAASTADRRQDH
ncbi:MAG: hypothetical protein PHE83_02000 [Opitutaceae bacterium]|nr:hypothetical protein [Opitutaceae bacterium]